MSQYFSSEIKTAVRAAQYQHTDKLWTLSSRPKGVAMTLAGPKAPEVPILRALGFKDEDIFLVDREPDVLRECAERYPNCPRFSSFDRAFKALNKPIAFANLDYMGSLNEGIMRTVTTIGEGLAPNGVVLYTFLRGRENEKIKRSMGTVHETLEENRVSTYLSEVLTALGPKRYRHVYLNRYTNVGADGTKRGMPMGQLGFQRTDKRAPKKSWEAFVRAHIEEHHLINEDNAFDLLGSSSRWLNDKGYKSRNIAEIIGFDKVPTIASWLANHNR